MEKFSDYLNSQEHQDYLNLIDQAKTEYDICSKEFFKSLDYNDQLKVFYHVVKNLYEGSIIDKGSYRHILYEKFNFGPDSYSLGMDCGLLEINNSIYCYEEISNSLKDVFKYLNIQLDKVTFDKILQRFTYGSFGHMNSNNRNIQLSMNFDDN